MHTFKRWMDVHEKCVDFAVGYGVRREYDREASKTSRRKEDKGCGQICPTEYVNKRGDFDGVIILTDMEAPAPKACRAQRMWMTDAAGASRPYFQTRERVIAVS